MDLVWKGLFFVLAITFLSYQVNAASLVKRSTDSGKKVVQHGDQLFLVDEDDEVHGHNDNHEEKRSDDEDEEDEDEGEAEVPPPGEKIIHAGDELFLVEKSHHHGDKETINKRSAIKDESYRWTDKTVPYIFDHTFPPKDQVVIKKAMDEWSKHTCLKFRPATNSDKHKVKFVNGDGCFSFVGMVESSQDISLDKNGCRYVSTALHEIGHALGMYHTQVRPDRDRYIKIDLSDVKKNLQDNFIKQTWDKVHHYGVDYDFLSIMHYDGNSFTSHGGTSIKTLDPKWQKIIGEVKHLSFGDIEMMNKMYHCAPASCHLKDSDCPGTSFVDKTCKCVCPGSSSTHPVVPCSGSSSSSSQKASSGSHTAETTTEAWDDSEWEYYKRNL